MGKLKGAKIASSHSAVIDAALPITDELRNWSQVTKISPGIIIAVRRRSSERVCKITYTQGCMLLTVLQKSSKQEIRIYSRNLAEVERLLIQFLQQKNYRWSTSGAPQQEQE
ncbi:MAG: DUF2103 domain-containing protein [Patescibacteria group bacterium]